MSDIPTDWRDQLNIREQIARIDRNQAEINKLFAEARKFNRDPWVLVLAALIAAFAALIARLPEILKAFGLP
jgi:hypothetical protein